MFWFTGHASGDGWPVAAFQSHDDDWVARYETRWGERDLEWAAIAACGPLQEISNGQPLRTRWGPAFEGLHMLNGYATVSNDNDMEGGLLASHMRGSVGSSASASLSVRQSWAAMAIAVQGPDVIHASMGPIAADGVSNITDYFWGQGAVGPDIRGTQIRDFWVYRGNS
jgi:hypothetical protein